MVALFDAWFVLEGIFLEFWDIWRGCVGGQRGSLVEGLRFSPTVFWGIVGWVLWLYTACRGGKLDLSPCSYISQPVATNSCHK